MAVGAPHESSGARGINGNQNDNSVYDAGAVYVFVRNGASWAQQAYVKASNPADERRVRARRRAERRRQHDGRVGLLGSEQRDRHQRQPGRPLDPAGRRRLRLHAHAATTWTQQAYIKASNTGEAGTATASATAISSASRWRSATTATRSRSARITEDSARVRHQRQPGGQLGDVGRRRVRVRAHGQRPGRSRPTSRPSNPDAGDLFGYTVSLERRRQHARGRQLRRRRIGARHQRSAGQHAQRLRRRVRLRAHRQRPGRSRRTSRPRTPKAETRSASTSHSATTATRCWPGRSTKTAWPPASIRRAATTIEKADHLHRRRVRLRAQRRHVVAAGVPQVVEHRGRTTGSARAWR